MIYRDPEGLELKDKGRVTFSTGQGIHLASAFH